MNNPQFALTTSVDAHLAKTTFDTSILAGQLSPSSIAMYERDFAAYLDFARDEQASFVSPATFARWRTFLATHTQLSPNSINRMLSAVRRVIKEAGLQGYLANDMVEAFKGIAGVKPRALRERIKADHRTRITPRDMRRLCEAPDTDTLTGIRDRAFMATLASSGCRVGEIVTLTVDQIHKREGGYLLTVMGKTDDEPREAPLSIEAHEAIQVWLAVRGVETPYVFNSFDGRGERTTTRHLTTVGAWKAVQKYAAACGLDHIKPHDFRRFVGTRLAEQDLRQAQKALGHKRIDTTTLYVLDDLKVGLTDGLY
jgi:integrase/recombinase XerD